MEALNLFEAGILQSLYELLHCSFLDQFFSLVTRMGDGGMIWILLAGVLLLMKKQRRTGLTLVLALLIGAVSVNLLMKPIVGRPRPFQADPGIFLLIPPPGDASFPSGHTLASFEAAAVLFFRHCRAWIPVLVLAVLIGFSRLYLCVHYPTDVLFGMLLGIFNGWIACRVIDDLWGEKKTGDKLPD